MFGHGVGPGRITACGCTRVLAWTVVNDAPGAAADEASDYSIVVAARSSTDLAAADNSGVQWDWDSRNEL
jgi:hypothetical protein